MSKGSSRARLRPARKEAAQVTSHRVFRETGGEDGGKLGVILDQKEAHLRR